MTEQELLARRSAVAEKFARRLRIARARSGLFQSEVAEACGVDTKTIARWECGLCLSQLVAAVLALEVCGEGTDLSVLPPPPIARPPELR